MNYRPLVRVTSYNRKSSFYEREAYDAAHIRYIGRMGTLTDEHGTPISAQDALKKFDHMAKTPTCRVTISIPRGCSEAAMREIMQELAERYGAGQYVCAYHPGSTDNADQPHLHVMFASHTRWPWRNFRQAKTLREALGARFQSAGIAFTPKGQGLRRAYNQREFHALKRGKQLWKSAMAGAARSAIRAAEGDPVEFVKCMVRLGFILTSSPRGGSINVTDPAGNRCRLSRLFSNVDEHIRPIPAPATDNDRAAKEGEKTETRDQREPQRPAHTDSVRPSPAPFSDRLRAEIERQQRLTARYQQQTQTQRHSAPGL